MHFQFLKLYLGLYQISHSLPLHHLDVFVVLVFSLLTLLNQPTFRDSIQYHFYLNYWGSINFAYCFGC